MPCRICAVAQLIHGLYGAEMVNLLLTVALFAGVLLLIGAWKKWRRGDSGQQMWLMVIAALVIFANVAIWVVPDNKGQSLITGEVK